MKKVIAVFLTMALVLTNFEGWSFLKDIDLFKQLGAFQGVEKSFADTYGDFEYTSSNSSVTITKYLGYDAEVIIPSEIDGKEVTIIGSTAFASCSSLESVTIPKTVRTIKDNAFFDCDALKNIEIQYGVTIIERAAFALCDGLENIVIPNSVKSLGECAFYRCSNLKSVKLPNSITILRQSTFYKCINLPSIEIPRNVVTIEDSVFDSCSSLTCIYGEEGSYAQTYAQENNIKFVALKQENDVSEFEYTISDDSNVTIDKYIGSDSEVIIPSEIEGMKVTNIKNSAFQDCTCLKSIKIPNGVTTIGNNVFWGCSNLESIEIPNSVTSIGIDAFYSCKSLTSIEIPEGVTTVSYSMFRYCSGLTSVTIPNTVTTIELSAFYGCSGLTSIEIPDSVTDIGVNAFFECSSLKNIYIPQNVTNIGEDAFYNCKSLIAINVDENNQNYASIDGVLFSKDLKQFKALPGAKTSYSIPDGVTSIAKAACDGNKNLQSIKIPNTVTSIGENSFASCNSLTNVDIPGSVDSIGSYAFAFCDNLISVNMSKGVKTIQDHVFAYCKNLQSVKIPESVTTIGENILEDCNSLVCIYGKSGSYAETYANENNIPFEIINNLPEESFYYNISNNKVTITGLKDNTSKDIVIPDEIEGYPVTRIDAEVFDENKIVQSIKLPKYFEDLSYIDYGETLSRIFKGCENLKSIEISEENTKYKTIDGVLYSNNNIVIYPEGKEDKIFEVPDGIERIASDSFYHVKNLEELKIPDSVTYIGYGAFSGCKSLKSINIPNSVKTIGNEAFGGCQGLIELQLPGSAEIFADEYFISGCTNLESIEIIGENDKFSTNDGILYNKDQSKLISCPEGRIKKVEIPNSVTTIGSSAFSWCSKLEEIIIPDSVSSIVDAAFYECDGLKSIVIPKSVKSMGDSVFSKCDNLIVYVYEGSYAESYARDNGLNFEVMPDKDEKITDEGLKYKKDGEDIIITGYTGSSKEVIIPSELDGIKVTLIGNNSFKNTGIENISIPDTVTSIGDEAFYGCPLKEINLPTQLESIGYAAFSSDYIKSVKIPNKLLNATCEPTEEEYRTPFSECKNLEKVEFEDGLIKIPNCMLSRCKSVKEVVIPKSVTSIGIRAFEECSSLTSIIIPKSIKSIEEGVFSYCPNLIIYSYSGSYAEDYANYNNIPFEEVSMNLSEDKLTLHINETYILKTIMKPDSINNQIIKWSTSDENIVSVDEKGNIKANSIGNAVITATNEDLGLTSTCEVEVGYNQISSTDITMKQNDYYYTGNQIKPIIIVKDGEQILEEGNDYTIEYGENVNVGEGSITVIGKGTYEGNKTVIFNILSKINVKFDNGTDVVIKEVEKDEVLNYTPETPTKKGYEFVGWFTDVDDITTEYKSGVAYTEDVTYTAKYAHVQMLGAQGKVIVDDKSGIRFGTKIYDDGDEIVEKGTLIIPVSVLGDQKLTLDTDKVARSVANVLYDQNEEENYVTYLGTLVGIPRIQFGAEITASSYVIYRDKAGNEYTVYSPYKNGSTTINKLLGL